MMRVMKFQRLLKFLNGFPSSALCMLTVVTVAMLFFHLNPAAATTRGDSARETTSATKPSNIGFLKKPQELVNDCLRCHGMETLGYQDRTTGRLVNLHVDKAAFLDSNHKGLRCLDCHQEGYEKHPHTEKAKAETLYCLNCHDDPKNPKFANYRFKEVETQFKKSIHFEKHGDKFTCFSCHKPHAFVVAKNQAATVRIIAQDNGMCLNCHASPARFTDLTTKRKIPDLDTAHVWLPNTQLHWSKVRCVECHTPHGERISHEILGAKRAERNCAACHTRDSILMTQLYKYRASESRDKFGFINASILNEAYIIGATRNEFLDWLGLLLVGSVTLGVSGHGVGRWIAARRRRKYD